MATLTRRAEVLEDNVQVLATLPDRVTAIESQVGQLRTEMRDGFAGVRQELKGGSATLRQEMKGEFTRVRQETRGAIKESQEETRRHMRVLHEEVIDRLKRIGDGLDNGPRA